MVCDVASKYYAAISESQRAKSNWVCSRSSRIGRMSYTRPPAIAENYLATLTLSDGLNRGGTIHPFILRPKQIQVLKRCVLLGIPEDGQRPESQALGLR